MMTRGIVLAAAAGILVGSVPGEGQTANAQGWRVGVGVGWVQHATRDRLGSSQGFGGWGAPLGVELERVGPRSAHALAFGFSSMGLPARNGAPTEVEELGAVLRYSYDRRVATGPSRTWYVGGGWVTTAFLRAYSYGGGEVWDGHSGVVVRGRAVQKLGGGRSAEVTGSFGLLGWSMRPPYGVESNTTLALHERPWRIVTDLGRPTTPFSRPSLPSGYG